MKRISAEATQEIQEIYDANGAVRPTDVVEKAKDESSALHQYFIWDDEKAGAEYRLLRARNLIRNVTVTVNDAPERLVHVPKIQRSEDNQSESNEGYYRPVIKMTAAEYEVAYAEAAKSLRAAEARIRDLERVAKESKQNELQYIGIIMEHLRQAGVALDRMH